MEYGEPAGSFRKHLELLREAGLLEIEAVRGRGIRLRLRNGYPYRGPMIRREDSARPLVLRIERAGAHDTSPATPVEGQSQCSPTLIGSDRPRAERAPLSTRGLEPRDNKEAHPDRDPGAGFSLRDQEPTEAHESRNDQRPAVPKEEQQAALRAALGAGYTSGIAGNLEDALRPRLDPRLDPVKIREAVARLSTAWDGCGAPPSGIAEFFYRSACKAQEIEPDPLYLRTVVGVERGSAHARSDMAHGGALSRLREREPQFAALLEREAGAVTDQPAGAVTQAVDELAKKRLKEGRGWGVRKVGAYLRSTAKRIAEEGGFGVARTSKLGVQP